MTSLDISANGLGELVLPEGWTKGWKEDYSGQEYKHTDGRKQKEHPGKPEGVIALANAIKNNRAMTSLDISANSLGAEGAKHIAVAIPKCT